MERRMLRRSVLAAFGLMLCAVTTQSSATDWPAVLSAAESKVVFLKIRSVLPTGEVRMTNASGVLLSRDGYVLSNSHILHAVKADKTEVSGALQMRNAADMPMTIMEDDQPRDLLLLKFDDELPPRECAEAGNPRSVRKLEELLMIGFPGVENAAGRLVRVANKTAERGRWVIEAGGLPGDSGSPLFNAAGQLVAIYRGAYEAAGLAHAVPINHAYMMLVEAWGPPRPDGTWSDAAPEFGAWSKSLKPAMPNKVKEVSIPVNQEKGDHPNAFSTHSRDYELKFDAPDGYTIDSATLVKRSDTRVSNLVTQVMPDRKSVKVTFRLTSGPQIDQYRGWLRGDLKVVLREQQQ